MGCEECLGDQCLRGKDYFAKVQDVAAQFKANPAGITLAALFSTTGIDRNEWYSNHNNDGVKACVEIYLGESIVGENSPTRDQPKRQALRSMSRLEEKRTRHTPH